MPTIKTKESFVLTATSFLIDELIPMLDVSDIFFDQPLLEWHKLSLKNNNKLEYTVLPDNCRGKVMHGAILPILPISKENF